MGCDARGEILINRPMRLDQVDKPVCASVTRAENNPGSSAEKACKHAYTFSRVTCFIRGLCALEAYGASGRRGRRVCLRYVNLMEKFLANFDLSPEAGSSLSLSPCRLISKIRLRNVLRGASTVSPRVGILTDASTRGMFRPASIISRRLIGLECKARSAS